MKKILILGKTGFVGQNIFQFLSSNLGNFSVWGSSSKTLMEKNVITLNILDTDSYHSILHISPDYIIDCSGYGVVKHQQDIDLLYKINYFEKTKLLDFIQLELPNVKWIQIGTAFEYDLSIQKLTENSSCLPLTHYGVSKLQFNNYLQQRYKGVFTILRPFGMFGPGEDISKFFPLLINAQQNNEPIDLSNGLQSRDYFYVKDLAQFVLKIIKEIDWKKINNRIINLGSNQPTTLRELGKILAAGIPKFNPELWQWSQIAQRNNENDIFYNHSDYAKSLGFELTNLEEAFNKTIQYYYRNKS